MRSLGALALSIILALTTNLIKIKEDNKEYVTELETIETMPEKIEEVVPEIEIQYESLGMYTITHYCSCSKCCDKTDGITASGTKVTPNRTIAAPKEFPFGTKLLINGQEYVVEDRGGAIKSNRLDIYCSSHIEALQKGIIHCEVFKIIEKE